MGDYDGKVNSEVAKQVFYQQVSILRWKIQFKTLTLKVFLP